MGSKGLGRGGSFNFGFVCSLPLTVAVKELLKLIGIIVSEMSCNVLSQRPNAMTSVFMGVGAGRDRGGESIFPHLNPRGPRVGCGAVRIGPTLFPDRR